MHLVLTEPCYRANHRAAELKTMLTDEMVVVLTKTVLIKYLHTTIEEVQSWEEDAEEFLNAELSGGWLYQLKQSAETLMCSLIKKFRSLVPPLMLQALQEVLLLTPNNNNNNNNNNVNMNHLYNNNNNNNNKNELVENTKTNSIPLNVMIKEGVYWALSMAHVELKTEVSFASMWTQYWEYELLFAHKIIQRRLLMILDSWVSEIPSDLQSRVHHHVLTLMQRRDSVLSLYCAVTLRDRKCNLHLVTFMLIEHI